jgi:hypothetical protein
MADDVVQALFILGVALIATGLFGLWLDRRK